MQPLGTSPVETGSQSPFQVDRRRVSRHRVRTPAYASISRNSGSQALDTGHILDISEDGMAIYATFAMEAGHTQDFRLHLPGTEGLVLTAGSVAWADSSGRAGICFATMPEPARLALRRWLLADGEVNRAADFQGETIRAQPVPELDLTAPTREDEDEYDSAAHPDYTTLLAALEAVGREVELLGPDLDAASYLIARRAQAFTRASGAAIALSEGAEMICRATAGPDAPDLGARLRVGDGFSGECVSSGQLLRCDDSDTDTRVNGASCRALGIRSMVAAPILCDGTVIGLLEVFSSEPNAFGSDDESALRRLAEILTTAAQRANNPDLQVRQLPGASVDDEFPVEGPSALPLREFFRSSNLVLSAAAVTVAFVVLWLAGNWNEDARGSARSMATSPSARSVPQSSSTTAPAAAINLEGLRRLAESGDPAAEFAVGARYATGQEIPQDYTEAFRWFSKAAEQGYVIAEATVSVYYEAGRGVPVDPSRAYLWSMLAEAGGDQASKARTASLATLLTRSQVVSAQRQAKEWMRLHSTTGKVLPARP